MLVPQANDVGVAISPALYAKDFCMTPTTPSCSRSRKDQNLDEKRLRGSICFPMVSILTMLYVLDFGDA
jgi:hypothetical protein